MKGKQNRLRAVEILLLVGLAVFLASGVAALETQDHLAGKVVRLHVLANSDSREDQELKLQVRDVVLSQATEILESSASQAEAEERLRQALPDLRQAAQAEVCRQGYSYGVEAQLEWEDFPTKDYDGFSLPAGEYLSLRILIGEAQGQNWWCVVFPPLCTAVTSDVPVAALAAGITEEEVALITQESQEYVLKFKMVEWWETIKNLISEAKKT